MTQLCPVYPVIQAGARRRGRGDQPHGVRVGQNLLLEVLWETQTGRPPASWPAACTSPPRPWSAGHPDGHRRAGSASPTPRTPAWSGRTSPTRPGRVRQAIERDRDQPEQHITATLTSAEREHLRSALIKIIDQRPRPAPGRAQGRRLQGPGGGCSGGGRSGSRRRGRAAAGRGSVRRGRSQAAEPGPAAARDAAGTRGLVASRADTTAVIAAISSAVGRPRTPPTAIRRSPGLSVITGHLDLDAAEPVPIRVPQPLPGLL